MEAPSIPQRPKKLASGFSEPETLTTAPAIPLRPQKKVSPIELAPVSIPNVPRRPKGTQTQEPDLKGTQEIKDATPVSERTSPTDSEISLANKEDRIESAGRENPQTAVLIAEPLPADTEETLDVAVYEAEVELEEQITPQVAVPVESSEAKSSENASPKAVPQIDGAQLCQREPFLNAALSTIAAENTEVTTQEEGLTNSVPPTVPDVSLYTPQESSIRPDSPVVAGEDSPSPQAQTPLDTENVLSFIESSIAADSTFIPREPESSIDADAAPLEAGTAVPLEGHTKILLTEKPRENLESDVDDTPHVHAIDGNGPLERKEVFAGDNHTESLAPEFPSSDFKSYPDSISSGRVQTEQSKEAALTENKPCASEPTAAQGLVGSNMESAARNTVVPEIPSRPKRSSPVIPKRPQKPSQSPLTDEIAKKGPPPKPKKLSSKIAAFQQMFNQQESSPAPATTHPVKSGKLSTEKIDFAANLQNVMGRGIALPGMANPELMRKIQNETEDVDEKNTAEEVDKQKEATERPVSSKSRAKGPRGKKLPKAIAETRIEIAPRFQSVFADLWSVNYTKTAPTPDTRADGDLQKDCALEAKNDVPETRDTFSGELIEPELATESKTASSVQYERIHDVTEPDVGEHNDRDGPKVPEATEQTTSSEPSLLGPESSEIENYGIEALADSTKVFASTGTEAASETQQIESHRLEDPEYEIVSTAGSVRTLDDSDDDHENDYVASVKNVELAIEDLKSTAIQNIAGD